MFSLTGCSPVLVAEVVAAMSVSVTVAGVGAVAILGRAVDVSVGGMGGVSVVVGGVDGLRPGALNSRGDGGRNLSDDSAAGLGVIREGSGVLLEEEDGAAHDTVLTDEVLHEVSVTVVSEDAAGRDREGIHAAS